MKALKNVYQMMITSKKEAKGTFGDFPEQSRSSAARPFSPLLLNKTNISTMFPFRCSSEKTKNCEMSPFKDQMMIIPHQVTPTGKSRKAWAGTRAPRGPGTLLTFRLNWPHLPAAFCFAF